MINPFDSKQTSRFQLQPQSNLSQTEEHYYREDMENSQDSQRLCQCQSSQSYKEYDSIPICFQRDENDCLNDSRLSSPIQKMVIGQSIDMSKHITNTKSQSNDTIQYHFEKKNIKFIEETPVSHHYNVKNQNLNSMQQIRSYVQILQKRNIAILSQLQTVRNKNSHLVQLLSIFTFQKNNQNSVQDQETNKLLTLQAENINLQNQISQMSISNQKLTSQNKYLKQLVLSANRNYQQLQGKHNDLNLKYLDMLEQNQSRENQFKMKIQELKNIFTKIVAGQKQKLSTVEVQNQPQHQHRHQQVLKERKPDNNNVNQEKQNSQYLSGNVKTMKNFDLFANFNFNNISNHQSLTNNQQNQNNFQHNPLKKTISQFQSISNHKESADQNYRKLFLKTLKGKK